MTEEERIQEQRQAQAARELLLAMARSYLAQRGSSRDLGARSRLVVNGILAALHREDLQVPAAPEARKLH